MGIVESKNKPYSKSNILKSDISKREAEQIRAEFDAPWKKILDLYFADFMLYCWFEKYEQIDWSKQYKILDKELLKISRNASVTNRIVDKLIEISLKNGKEAYVLLHIEIQGDEVANFEERMFTYRYRLRDLYNKPIASLAILIDSNKNWRPCIYKEELWDSYIEMKFPILKLVDYESKIVELEASNNRFAAVILAQLAALKEESTDAKLISKLKLIRWLYRRGWYKQDVISLLIFIDWVFILPYEFEVKCRQEIQILEEELKVEYITSFERIGIQKGIEQGIEKGIQQGECTLLLRQLQRRFKEVPEFYRQMIESANAETLLTWGERVLESNNLEEIFNA